MKVTMDTTGLNQTGKSNSVSPQSGPGHQSEESGQTFQTSNSTAGSCVASEMEGHKSQIDVSKTVNKTQSIPHTSTPPLCPTHSRNEGEPGAHDTQEQLREDSTGTAPVAGGGGLFAMSFNWTREKAQEDSRKKNIAKLEWNNSELRKKLTEMKSEFCGFKAEAHERDSSHQRKTRELYSQIQQVEGEKMIQQTQIQNMSKIIADLSQRGLPLPPDDGYFQDEFSNIVAEIRQWARLFTRGQPPFMLESLEQLLEHDSPEKVGVTLLKNFAPTPGVLHFHKALGTKFRTRCVEILLCRRAFEDLLLAHPVGLANMNNALNDLYAYMETGAASAEDRHLWEALSIHLLTQDNKMFSQLQRKQVHELTKMFLKELEPFGILGRATPEGLQDIVKRISELGLAIAKLPYRILPLIGAPKGPLSAGCPFEADIMDNLESSSESELELQLQKVPTSLFLCQPWVKVSFTHDGTQLSEKYTIIMKARVSCFT